MSIFDRPIIGLDTETTGLYYPRDRAFCVSFTAEGHEPLSIDFRTEAHHIPALQHDMRRARGRFVMHNAQFDVKMLRPVGIDVPLDKVDCTVVRACLINEHFGTVFPWGKEGDYTLETLCRHHLKAGKIEEIWGELAKLFGGLPTRNVQAPRLCKAPWDLVRPYMERDALLAHDLWLWQEKEIARQGIHEIVDFERRLLPTLCRAAMRGIPVSVPVAEEAIDRMTVVIDEKQAAFERKIGIKGFNVNSGPQVKDLFKPEQVGDEWISGVNGCPLETTKSGGPSLNAKVLEAMNDPVADMIGEIRSLIKTRDTFLAKHVIEHEYNGRVYPTINQTKGEEAGTGTGRLSYTDPAMQQIPSRDEEVAAIIKPCFLPEHGQKWLDGDMNTFEVRIFAHLVAPYNDSLVRVYQQDPMTDLHSWVGSLLGVPRKASRPGEINAKTLNLGMIFNKGRGAVAHELQLPWEWSEFESRDPGTGKPVMIRYRKPGPETIELLNTYHRKIQGVKKLADVAKEIAESRGYIKTKTGRRLRFPRKYKSYKASGLLIQATAADINKMMWMGIEEALGNDGTILLNTHDSFSMSVDPSWERIFKRVQEVTNTLPSRIPLIMDLNGVGDDWWDAIRKDKK